MNTPRIIIFSGKGGVGKTTLALATALQTAAAGLRTIVLSLDQAHSLRDGLGMTRDKLFVPDPGGVHPVNDSLSIQEIDVQREIEAKWSDIAGYLFSLFKTTGFSDVVAEELAMLPGMNELIGLLYINRYVRDKTYDCIILDCAPTGESIQFIAMPDIIEWYMDKVFFLQRNVARLARPFIKTLSDLPLPEDRYFAAIKKLFHELKGINTVLFDPSRTTARLVTNLEKMVVQETKRAFLYFNLFGIHIDAVYINRVLGREISDPFFAQWKKLQQQYSREVHRFFYPVPIFELPLMPQELVGVERLRQAGDILYGPDRPAQNVFFKQRSFTISGEKGAYRLRLFLPFIAKGSIYLYRKDAELIIRIGSFKKYFYLPEALKNMEIREARKQDDYLTIYFAKPGRPE